MGEIRCKALGVFVALEKDMLGGDRDPEVLKGLEKRYIGSNS